MLDKTFFVVNPNASRGKLCKSWDFLSDLISKKIQPFVFEFTKKPGDAVKITKRALEEGYSLIVSVGGDGTLNECVNGFMQAKEKAGVKKVSKAALGILPLGRGSDFCRMLNIPRKPQAAIHHLLQAKVRHVDVGEATYHGLHGQTETRHFINVASLGISGNVVNWANKTPGWVPPKLTYFYSVLRSFSEYHHRLVKVSCDQKTWEVSPLMVIIGNGRYFGSGMKICPHAVLDDGLFDVMIIDQMKVLDCLRNLDKLYTGKFEGFPHVQLFRTQKIHFEPLIKKEAPYVEVDGDTVGHMPATFTVLPKALSVKG